jgi:hypothetical protein
MDVAVCVMVILTVVLFGMPAADYFLTRYRRREAPGRHISYLLSVNVHTAAMMGGYASFVSALTLIAVQTFS